MRDKHSASSEAGCHAYWHSATGAENAAKHLHLVHERDCCLADALRRVEVPCDFRTWERSNYRYGAWALKTDDKAKHPDPEELVTQLWQADMLISRDQSASDVIRTIDASALTDERSQRGFSRLASTEAQRMKMQETECQRLRKRIADLTLATLILRQASWEPEGQRR